jgi:hypothetical protein
MVGFGHELDQCYGHINHGHDGQGLKLKSFLTIKN